MSDIYLGSLVKLRVQYREQDTAGAWVPFSIENATKLEIVLRQHGRTDITKLMAKETTGEDGWAFVEIDGSDLRVGNVECRAVYTEGTRVHKSHWWQWEVGS